MKVTRIVNRGRIAPSSPKPIIDSGRTSFSSASEVSTIETHSPEPRLEEVNQKLQDTVLNTAFKKKLFIGLTIAGVCVITLAIILGVVLSQTSSNSSSDLNSPNTTTVTMKMNVTNVLNTTTTIPTSTTTIK